MKFKKLSIYLFMLLSTVYSVFAITLVPDVLKDVLKSVFNQESIPAYGLKFIMWIVLYSVLYWVLVKKVEVFKDSPRTGSILSLTISLDLPKRFLYPQV